MLEPQYKKGRSWWPGLRILDRYIIRKFLGTYLFSIAMIIVVVVIFDYVEKIDDFTTTKAPFKSIIMDYYLNFVPFFVNQFSALFTFIACIFFTSKLAYQTEIVAMLSGGMSFRRLMWPYFIGASVITIISLALSLWVIPISQRTCVEFEQTYIPRRKLYQYDVTSTVRSSPVPSSTFVASARVHTMLHLSHSRSMRVVRCARHWRLRRLSLITQPSVGQHRDISHVISMARASSTLLNIVTSIPC